MEWDAGMFRRAERGGLKAQAAREDRGADVSVELVGQRLVEHEVRDWFGLGGIEGRSLVEEEVALRRTTSG